MRFFFNALCLLFISTPLLFANPTSTDSLETQSSVLTDSLIVADSLSSSNVRLPNYSNSPYLEGLFNAEPSMLMLPPDNTGILGSYGTQPEVWRPAKPYEPGADAGGDLNLSIPIMTVPGRNGLDFPINFNYRSGILVDQPSGWLGLGWSFDPGSITRDVSEHIFQKVQNFGFNGTSWAQISGEPHQEYHGDEITSQNYSAYNFLPDNYYATGPFGYFNFAKTNLGATTDLQNEYDFTVPMGNVMKEMIINPWQPVKLKLNRESNSQVIQQFVVTSPDGTRYLFGNKVAIGGTDKSTITIKGQQISNWVPNNRNLQYSPEIAKTYIYTNVWRLMAILGQDYEGEAPPTSDSKGSWVKFDYTTIPNVMPELGANSGHSTPIFLNSIETPTHKAAFQVDNRNTAAQQKGGALSKITLTNKSTNTIVNTVELLQSPFETPVNGIKRSKLDKINFKGINDTWQPGYGFDYYGVANTNNTNIGISESLSSGTMANEMGYLGKGSVQYNNDTSTITFGEDTKHSWSLMAATFPTGYREVYEYESDRIVDEVYTIKKNIRTTDIRYQTSGSQTTATNYGGGTPFVENFTVGGKFGGIRLKNIKRYENRNATAFIQTNFSYGSGYLSQLPRYYNQSFKQNFRDDSRIYYNYITKTLDHGASMTTTYSTKGNYAEATESPYLWIAEGGAIAPAYGVVFGGNNQEMWGKVLEVKEDNDISTKTTKYTYTPQRTAISDILPPDLDYGTNIKYYSFLANDLTQKITEIKDKGNNKVFNSIETYTYNRLNQLKTIETKSEGLPTLLKVLNYAHEVPAYQELFSRNLLTPVAQETTWEKVSRNEFKLHGSSISQMAKFNNSWFAKKSWVLKDEIRTLPQDTSASKFTAWTNDETCTSIYQEANTNGVWQCTGRNLVYDDNGRLTKSESPSGAITELFFGSDANPCSNQPTDTLYKGNYLTCAQITLGTEVLSKKIKYDNTDFKNPWLNITHVSNLNNTDAQKFNYDNLGRLTQVQSYQNGQWLALNETSYGFLLNPDGTVSATIPANHAITKTYPTGAINTTDYRESASFYDGLGREVLMSSRLTPYEISYKQTQFDVYDRPTRVYKPFRYAFATAYAGSLYPTLTELEDGVKGYYNALYPYQDLTYNNANIVTKAVHPRMSATTEEFVGSDMSYENYKMLDNSFSTTQGASVSKQVSEDGSSYTLTYTDLYGRAYRIEKWNLGVLQSVTASEFDAMGRVTKMYPPNYFNPPAGSVKENWITTYAYNTLGQITHKKSPDAGEIRYLYDHAGNLRYSQDGNQRQVWKFSYTSYDAANRPLFSGEKAGDFNGLNPFKTPADERSVQNHTLSYNVYDKKPTVTLPSRTTEVSAQFQENLKGQLAVTAYRIGNPDQISVPPYFIPSNLWQTTAFSYDEQGRIKQKTQYTDNVRSPYTNDIVLPTLSIQYEYNALGEPVQVKKTLGTEKFNEYFEYNLLGQVAKIYSNHGEFPTKTTTTGGTKPLVYKSLVELEGEVFDVEYTNAQTGLSFNIPNSQYLKVVNAYLPTGQLDTQTFVGPTNGVGGFYTMDYSYNLRDLLTQINKPSTAAYTTKFSALYTHSKVGNIETAEFFNPLPTGVTGNSRYKMKYNYDAQYRLSSTQYEGCGATCNNVFGNQFAENLSYDPNGNIKTLQRSNENGSLIDNLSYQYATNNCLLSVNDATYQSLGWDGKSQSFQYDSNGNISHDGKFGYQYDVRNLPIALNQGGALTTYRYNAAGSRIYKRSSKGVSEYYIMDGEMPIALLNSNGVLQYWNTSYGKYVKVGTSYSAQYYLKDHLGSVRVVLDQSGNRTQSQDYYAYGLAMPTRSYFGSTKEGFTGKETDLETGLQYFGARYYMPHLGRWMAIDPLAEKHPDWTPYNYVLANPLKFIDPDGRQVDVTQFDPVSQAYRFGERVVNSVYRNIQTLGGLRESRGINGGLLGMRLYEDNNSREVWKVFKDWRNGTGERNLYYGRNSPMTWALRNGASDKFDKAIDFFYDKYKGADPKRRGSNADKRGLIGASVTGYPARFSTEALYEVNGNSVTQQVGSFTINIFSDDGINLRVQAKNTLSITSFLYGLGPEYEREDGFNICYKNQCIDIMPNAGADVYQTFEFIVPIDYARIRGY